MNVIVKLKNGNECQFEDVIFVQNEVGKVYIHYRVYENITDSFYWHNVESIAITEF